MKRLAPIALACALACSLALAFSTDVQAQSAAGAQGQAVAPSAHGTGSTSAVVLANVPSEQSGVDWGRAQGVIDARTSDVLAILHDYSRYAGLFPHFEKSRVLSQRGTDAIVYLEAKILHGAATLWGQLRMSSTKLPDDGYLVEAKLMKGKGNMAQMLARWEIHPRDQGQRTDVSFQLLVDPDLPFPDMVVSNEMKNSAGHAFRALRKRAGQRASYATRPSTAM